MSVGLFLACAYGIIPRHLTMCIGTLLLYGFDKPQPSKTRTIERVPPSSRLLITTNDSGGRAYAAEIHKTTISIYGIPISSDWNSIPELGIYTAGTDIFAEYIKTYRYKRFVYNDDHNSILIYLGCGKYVLICGHIYEFVLDQDKIKFVSSNNEVTLYGESFIYKLCKNHPKILHDPFDKNIRNIVVDPHLPSCYDTLFPEYTIKQYTFE